MNRQARRDEVTRAKINDHLKTCYGCKRRQSACGDLQNIVVRALVNREDSDFAKLLESDFALLFPNMGIGWVTYRYYGKSLSEVRRRK